MIHIGIDLAWTYKNETAICIIDDSGSVILCESSVFSDDEIVAVIVAYKDQALCISIDAPLIINNQSGSRPAEGQLMRYPIHGHHLSVFNANRAFMVRSYGQIRGEALARKLLEELGGSTFSTVPEPGRHTICEVFPSGNCCGLFPETFPVKYKVKSKIPFDTTKAEMSRMLARIVSIEVEEKRIKGILEHFDGVDLDISKARFKHLEDKVDAFLCAYGTYAVAKGMARMQVFGDVQNGFISVAMVF